MDPREPPCCARRRVRSRRWGACTVAFAVAFFASRIARAGGGAATDAYEGIAPDAALDVHGLLDAYWQHDFLRPPSGMVGLRAFDVRSDTPALNFARLTLAHAPGTFGFRLDAGVGDTPNGYERSDPATAEHPGLSRALSYIEQAFVSATVPIGAGVWLDVGKFGTPVGLEDNESQQNWSYSRSLLYSWAEPTYHAGLRVTVPLSDALGVSAFWVNGWNANVVDGNGMRTFALAASWSPSDKLDMSLVYMAGPERAPQHLSDPALAFRQEFDGSAVYAPVPQVALATTADYGIDAADGGVHWWGIGGYVRWAPRGWLAGTVRGEHYADPQGFTTGTAQRIAELTGTLEMKTKVLHVDVIGRIEYRRDQSDFPVFEAASPPRVSHQDTLTAAVMASF